MAVVHKQMMVFARRLGNVDTIDQQDSALNGFTKLARTYLMQMDALKRSRTGGEQTVTVQHVNVNEGAQAIVGNVTTQSGTRTAAAVAQTKASAPARTQSATAPKPIGQATGCACRRPRGPQEWPEIIRVTPNRC